MLEISPGSYQAGGVNTKIHTVTVDQKFYTPRGEVTNAQAHAVIAKYGYRPTGSLNPGAPGVPCAPHKGTYLICDAPSGRIYATVANCCA